jgi:hypothetical protein
MDATTVLCCLSAVVLTGHAELPRGHKGVQGHAGVPGGIHGRHGGVQGHTGLPGVLHGVHGGVLGFLHDPSVAHRAP